MFGPQRRDARAAMRQRINEPFERLTAERLANRHNADRQLCRKVAQNQWFAGHVLAVQNHLSEHVGNSFDEGALIDAALISIVLGGAFMSGGNGTDDGNDGRPGT
jgi:hypothetical protein